MTRRAAAADPRIHHHPLAVRTVFVAPRRAARPADLGLDAVHADAPCPFCPGHESLTPPAVLRAPAIEEAPWHARIIPNRYPVVEPLATEDGDVRPAHGVHEVVIESAAHVRSILAVPRDRWREVWELIRRRLEMLAADERLVWATVFKNSGEHAGASLEHLHSQLVALDFVPPVMAAELAAAAAMTDPFGDLVRRAEATGCVVATAADLVALVPPAPRQPFETWIVPRVSEPHFHATSAARVAALADLTQDVVARLAQAAPRADFNWWLHQAPFTRPAVESPQHWHWHLEILPRLAHFAGFELGTGCHITTAAPEESARLLTDGPA